MTKRGEKSFKSVLGEALCPQKKIENRTNGANYEKITGEVQRIKKGEKQRTGGETKSTLHRIKTPSCMRNKGGEDGPRKKSSRNARKEGKKKTRRSRDSTQQKEYIS